jgi:hypothetical protein
MLITTNPQLMLWETILPPGYRTCPHDLPRIMDGQRLAPGFEQPRQRTVQPAAPRRLHQQRATGVRHQRLTPRGRAAPYFVGQRDHRARRLHTCRPGVLRPQAQRGQR